MDWVPRNPSMDILVLNLSMWLSKYWFNVDELSPKIQSAIWKLDNQNLFERKIYKNLKNLITFENYWKTRHFSKHRKNLKL